MRPTLPASGAAEFHISSRGVATSVAQMHKDIPFPLWQLATPKKIGVVPY